jgi:sugar lactone lactonase YvrE
MVKVFDSTACVLGEGPLWHPNQQCLFWFDILEKRLFQSTDDGAINWVFDENVSAAGWVDEDRLLVASETALSLFDISTGKREPLVALEEDNPGTRSNDGRADPFGGFWIGTMGKAAKSAAGAIYRFYKGEVRKLVDNVTVSNAICFSPDGTKAYFSDTTEQTINTWSLNEKDGWPVGSWKVFIDLREDNLFPDGAVVDAEGNLWNAQWGANRVARYSPQGVYMDHILFPASQISCPAFGGPDLKTLFVTSAAIDVQDEMGGQTFTVPTDFKGQKEHRVIL